MQYYNQEQFLQNDMTQTAEFLDKIYVAINNACEDMVSKLSSNIDDASKIELVASQIIATSFFQFKGAGVPEDVVKMIVHTYMSAEYTPFKTLKKHLYMINNTLLNAEKIYTVKELVMKYYTIFCEEYDKNPDPAIINTIMHNFSNDLKAIKEFNNELADTCSANL